MNDQHDTDMHMSLWLVRNGCVSAMVWHTCCCDASIGAAHFGCMIRLHEETSSSPNKLAGFAAMTGADADALT